VTKPIQSALNVLGVLETLASHPPMGLSEAARAAQLPKTTTLRCLLTLQEAGWVRLSEDRNAEWSLTNRALLTGLRAAPAGELAGLATEEMNHVREAVGESVHLMVRDGLEQIVVARADGVGAIRTYLPLGTRIPFHSSSSGRALLSAMSAEEAEAVLTAEAEAPGFDRARVEAHVEEARSRGFSVNEGEWREGVAGVGVPVRGAAGDLRGAISVSLPVARMEELGAEEIGRLLLESQRRLADRLR
jgi:DNA-binding IclR family transcriptional regulator